MFEADFTTPLNRGVRLDGWVDAACNDLRNADLQADIAQAGWVRAVLSIRFPRPRLATRLSELRPQFRAPLEAWTAEKDPQAAKF